MKLIYYPYKPMTITNKRPLVVETASPKVYTDLMNAFRLELDTIHLADDFDELLDVAAHSEWYGDPMLEIDLDRTFQRVVQKQLIKLMTDQEKQRLVDLSQQLAMEVLSRSFLLDLPLNVSPENSIPAIMKMVKLSYDEEIKQHPYDIIETVLKTLTEVDDHQLSVFTNLSHYLDVSQINNLVEVVADVDIEVLIIEFSKVSRQDMFANCELYLH